MVFAMACAFLCAQGIAMSETEATVPPLRHILDIGLTVAPDEMVEPGEVTLTFTVVNDSGHSANNLYVESLNGNYSESLGQVLAGESTAFTRAYNVSQAELDEGKLAFLVSHDDIISSGGEPVEYTLETLVTRTDIAPDIEFTRQISSESVAAGSTVMLTYRVRNTGNVPLTGIRITDALGSFAGTVDELDPGESKVFSSRITVDLAVSSRAEAVYCAPSVSDEEVSIKLDDIDIEIIEPVLTTALTLDRLSAKAGDNVNGVITIGAAGCDFSDVCVIDDIYNTVIADTIELHEDETLTVTCSWPVRGISDYRVRVEGTDAAGNRTEVVSNTVSLALTGEFEYSELSIAAKAQTPVINRAGKARINVSIKNSGNAAARDVVLSETALGEIHRFEFVPAGEPTMRSILVDVKENSEFLFSVAYSGNDGSVITAECEPVCIDIASDGAEPAGELDDSDGRSVYELNEEGTYYWMMGIGAAVLLVLVIILIISHDRERRERKLRKEMGKKRAAKTGRGDRSGRRNEK